MYQYSNTDFRGFEAVLRLQDFIDSLPGLAAFNKHKEEQQPNIWSRCPNFNRWTHSDTDGCLAQTVHAQLSKVGRQIE